MDFANRINDLGTETAFEVLGQVMKLRAQGKEITSFCIGEPDFNTPENIKQAGIKAIENNQTHYTASAGLFEVRETVAKYVNKIRGTNYSAKNIVILPCAKGVIFFTVMALVNPGDEVIYPNPGYPIYESAIDFFGGKRVALPMLEEKGFSFDLTDLMSRITDKTKLIILNSPQNPTGGVIPKKDLEKLAEVCKEKGIYVLSDEIYSQIMYDTEFNSIASIPGMEELTVILDGVSKTYAMTGWRAGYAVCNKELAGKFETLATNIVANTATFTQFAIKEALTGPQEEPKKMVQEFKERRDIIVDLLNEVPGFKCHKPLGAFYVFPNVTQTVKKLGFRNATDLQQYLLLKANVAVLTRNHFGKKNPGETQEYLRLSYATDKETIKKGLQQIKDAIANKELIEEFKKEKGI
ncbi:MAG: pyridoxal phosphate-dependent aminotransferase [Candidatus Diapherotrites archaeon]